MRNAISIVGLIFGGLLATALLLEFVIFRFFFLPSDLPRLAATESGQVLHFVPSQEGTYRVKHEIAAKFKVNKLGWNSGREDYVVSDRSKVAIIGDSYVEALQVDYDSSLAEHLEQKLADTDVYRFGISGSPLSHYLFMYRNAVAQFHPDIVVFVLVHNDFKESIAGSQSGLYTDSFAKWEINAEGEIGALSPPEAYTPRGIPTLIRRTGLYRYLVVRMRVNVTNLKRRFLSFFRDNSVQNSVHVANVDPLSLNDMLLQRVANSFFEELTTLSIHNAPLFLAVMDGTRGFDEKKCANGGDATIKRMNRLVAKVAAQHGIAFVDLGDAFLHAACKNGLSLRFKIDGHWTEAAHQVVADTIANSIKRYQSQ